MAWQVDMVQLQSEEIISHGSYVFVCLHVIHVQGIQIVETFIEWFADLCPDVDNRVKNT